LVESEAAERKWTYGLNVFEKYVEEILQHVGLPFETISQLDAVSLQKFDILIVACSQENGEKTSHLWAYAEQGGTIISYAGLNAMAIRLGYIQTGETGAGYAEIEPTRSGQPGSLRFTSANPWIEADEINREAAGQVSLAYTGIIKQGRPDGQELGPALLKFAIGHGSLYRWTVNIPLTIVHMQQGTGPVLDDGVPAADGSANVNEDILKADDRIALDWKYDRVHTETGIPYFPWPYADYWREALLRHVLQCALDKDLTLPFTGYWPDGIRHIATISHDSDTNQDEHAVAALKLLEECQIQTTWCMIEPGYGAPIYDQVKQAGHELAFHYNALEKDNGKWDEAEFNRQVSWVKQAIGQEQVTTNKNHYTRVEGWGELFLWLERNGILSDQTRGPSKKGNVGFLFGTCHPYFPIALFDEKNRFYDVLEIGFLTQDLDLGHLADNTVIEPFLQQAKLVNGAAHFLFHQIHIYTREEVRNAIRMLVSKANEMGFTFWKSKQIQDWTRLRRSVRITASDDEGNVELQSDEAVTGLVVWVPMRTSEAFLPDERHEMQFGIPCRKVVMNMNVEVS
ncbi:MAG: glycoside hydrolase/deacetylase, partial [Paenibacillus sp.]|nr:glycoside hydrolase/deacetylase [Paenibacillus sp.]